MTQEQIFQLKLASTDLAIRSLVSTDNLVAKATEIYDFLTAEVKAKEDAQKGAVVGLVKPSIAQIESSIKRD